MNNMREQNKENILLKEVYLPLFFIIIDLTPKRNGGMFVQSMQLIDGPWKIL